MACSLKAAKLPRESLGVRGTRRRSSTQALESADYIDKHFIQKGLLGVASGEGFYRYPNPTFEQPDFI